MRIMIIVGLLTLFVGCDFIMPSVEKSKTEKKQLAELQRQNSILERIAVAIEEK